MTKHLDVAFMTQVDYLFPFCVKCLFTLSQSDLMTSKHFLDSFSRRLLVLVFTFVLLINLNTVVILVRVCFLLITITVTRIRLNFIFVLLFLLLLLLSCDQSSLSLYRLLFCSRHLGKFNSPYSFFFDFFLFFNSN